MNGIRNGYNLRIPVIGKFHALKSSHGISGETDSDEAILFSNMDHLFKSFTYTCGIHKTYIFSDHI